MLCAADAPASRPLSFCIPAQQHATQYVIAVPADALRNPSMLEIHCQNNVDRCDWLELLRAFATDNPDALFDCHEVDTDCYVKRYDDLLQGFCGGSLMGCDWLRILTHWVHDGSKEERVFGCTPPLPLPPPPPLPKRSPPPPKKATVAVETLNPRADVEPVEAVTAVKASRAAAAAAGLPAASSSLQQPSASGTELGGGIHAEVVDDKPTEAKAEDAPLVPVTRLGKVSILLAATLVLLYAFARMRRGPTPIEHASELDEDGDFDDESPDDLFDDEDTPPRRKKKSSKKSKSRGHRLERL